LKKVLGRAIAEQNHVLQLSLLALVVIPELRISDLGLVDVREFKIISLEAGQE